ncbi:MAG: LytTR family transcriptional regulator, partial [Sporomusaceae bacterium]|nr:LytTR family transcriptional regulator [Sporomusaceae bacterium]
NRKIYLYTQNGAIDYYGKLEELEKQLDYRFVRCHRSYLVNLDHLNEYANGEIKLTNKTCVPVSRLRYQEVLAAMMEYMKKKED